MTVANHVVIFTEDVDIISACVRIFVTSLATHLAYLETVQKLESVQLARCE